MNLDELEEKIRAISSDPEIRGVANQLTAWKDNLATVHDLALAMERYIGNIWISSSQDHDRVYALWSAFRQESIEAIRGMTMNERLFSFGLLERFDALQSDSDRQALYAKLHVGGA
jgi:hypothetical protein